MEFAWNTQKNKMNDVKGKEMGKTEKVENPIPILMILERI